MNRYKIIVSYSVVDSNGNTVVRQMPFVVPGNSIEEAKASIQEPALVYINKVKGTLISVE